MAEHAQRGRGADRFARGVAGVVGAMLVVVGLWAFLSPRSFFDTLATFEPYNAHFLHDIGAFQIGLGAVLLLAAFLWDSLLVALAGVAVGNAFHLAAHAMDTDLGGSPSTDIPFFAIVTLLLAGAAVGRSRTGMRQTP